MKKYIFVLTLLASFMLSCSKQEQPADQSNEDYSATEKAVNSLEATVSPFKMVGDTKSTLSVNGSKLEFKWELNDKLGFWPANPYKVSEIKQAFFHISGFYKAYPNVGLFTSNGWGFLVGKKYYSYYPYTAGSSYNAFTAVYTGQTQTANNSTAHLGNFDYMHASVTVPNSGVAYVNYEHAGCVAIFNITLTSGTATTAFTNMTLSGYSYFVSSAVLNPSTDAITWTSKTTANTFAVKLGSGSGSIKGSGGKLTVYAMMCPVTWANTTITLTLKDSGGVNHTGTFKPTQNQSSGAALTYNVTMTN